MGMSNVPDVGKSRFAHGTTELGEGLAPISAFENPVSIHIGTIGSAFASTVVNQLGVLGVVGDATGHQIHFVIIQGSPIVARVFTAPNSSGNGRS